LAKYPISHNAGKTLGEFFKEILTFHIPPSSQRIILDPTCGRKHLWEEYLKKDLNGKTELEGYGKVIFSDIKPYGQNMVSDVKLLNFDYQFDGIIYDPPYFFGYIGSNDPRREDYGDYVQTYEDLLEFMDVANNKFLNLLKDDGKLIVKCADQYQTKERKFYPHHYTWINKLSNFDIIDMFVFIHHRLSPTAFQVKKRPCSVIMHTYFLIFKKKTFDYS
jgi:DNA modification methylase